MFDPSKRVVRTDIPNYTQEILTEIQDDDDSRQAEKDNGWWVPKSYDNSHTIFERAYMKFVNGNLNYADLANMVIHANDDDPYWNAAFPKTKQFCLAVKSLLGERGPLGRMCLWKMPPGMFLEPHTDNYKYHRVIRRWIYFLNQEPPGVSVKFNDVDMPCRTGTLLELQPAEEKHSFANHSEEDWYFLAFDTWDVEQLRMLSQKFSPKYAKSPQRLIYLSKH